MFPHFLELPSELKLSIIKKFESIPYVRFRRNSTFSNTFCEEHQRHLGIFIYRKPPELYLLNSLKETYPFYKRITEDDEDIDEPYFVVDYGRYHGEANLKLPMNLDNISVIRNAISGFNFTEISILNYANPEDDEKNGLFNQSFSHFMEAVQDIRIDTINLKNLPPDLFIQLTNKWDLTMVRLRKSRFNQELIELDFIKEVRHFSCTFTDNFDPKTVDFDDLLKPKSIVTLDFGSYVNKINWLKLEEIFKDYEKKLPELYFYRIYAEDETEFYELDLLERQGIIIPFGAFHMQQMLKEIVNCGPEDTRNKTEKFDYFFQEIQAGEKWRFISVSRKKWSFCTDICLVFEIHNSEECLNFSFLSIIDEILSGFYVIDYSDLWAKLEEVKEMEEKRKIILDFMDFIIEIYK